MPSARPSTADKRKTFRELHESGCFVIPNPWNVGSARYLQGLGFKALATTSSGYAHVARAMPTARNRMDDVLAHYREIAGATDMPVNADFENGFADDPTSVAENVTRCIATGVAGLSIEDSTGDTAKPLYDFDIALARVKAARAAIDKAGGDVVFTGAHRRLHSRPAGPRRDHPPAQGLCRRRRRLSLFARHQDPRADRGDREGGRPQGDQLPQPGALGFTVSDLAGMGVRRISVGGSLARVGDARLHQDGHGRSPSEGKFDGFAGLITNAELNKFFGEDRKNSDERMSYAAGRDRRSIATPAPLPGPVTLKGRYGRSSGSTPRGTRRAVGRDARPRPDLDLYSRGPFADEQSFTAWLADLREAQGARSSTPCSMPAGRAVGISSLMEIRPPCA